jgi:hypothetical protein
MRNLMHHLTAGDEVALDSEVADIQVQAPTVGSNIAPGETEGPGGYPLNQSEPDDSDGESDEETADPEGLLNSELDDKQILAGVETLTGAATATNNQLDESNSILFDPTDAAMSDILQYAQQQGTSLKFIDELFLRIRKHAKLGFNPLKAPPRKTFMTNLCQYVGYEGTPTSNDKCSEEWAKYSQVLNPRANRRPPFLLTFQE